MEQNEKFSESFYELQFYGIFLSDISDIVRELMVDAVDHVSSGFSKKLKFDEAIKQDVFNSMSQKYKEEIIKHLPMVHALVKKHLGVKKHILLPQDEIHRTPVTEQDEQHLQLQLDHLKNKYFALMSMSNICNVLIDQIGQTDDDIAEVQRVSQGLESCKKNMAEFS